MGRIIMLWFGKKKSEYQTLEDVKLAEENREKAEQQAKEDSERAEVEKASKQGEKCAAESIRELRTAVAN